MDKTQPIRLKHFHENDGGRAKNGTQRKQCGKECTFSRLKQIVRAKNRKIVPPTLSIKARKK